MAMVHKCDACGNISEGRERFWLFVQPFGISASEEQREPGIKKDICPDCFKKLVELFGSEVNPT